MKKLIIALSILIICEIALIIYLAIPEEKQTILSVTEQTLPQLINTEKVEKGLLKKDFKCRFVVEVTFCTQKYTPKVGVATTMGETHIGFDTIFVRLTDNKIHNISRLQHEVTHYMLYKYLRRYTNEEILTVEVNEKIAYETQMLFEALLKEIY